MTNKTPKIIISVLVGITALSLFFAWLGTPAKVSKYKVGTPEQIFEEYLDKKIGIDPENIRTIEFADRPDIPGQRLTLKFKNSNVANKNVTLSAYFDLAEKLVENQPPFELAYLNIWTVFDGTAGDGTSKEVNEGNFTIDYPVLKENIGKIDSPENFEKFLNKRGSLFVREFRLKSN